jgi:hypothetical protein
MKRLFNTSDTDITGSLPALRRAAKAARELAVATGTPFFVIENGRIVNLNPVRKKIVNRRKRSSSR